MKERDRAEQPAIVQLLSGEEFQMALDPQEGAIFHLRQSPETLILTNFRVINIGTSNAEQTISISPLSSVSSINLRNQESGRGRPWIGSLMAVGGLLVAIFFWAVVEVQILALILGGVPALFGISFMLNSFLSESTGVLSLMSSGQSIRFPLGSPKAKKDALVIVDRFWELFFDVGKEESTHGEITKTAGPENWESPMAPETSESPHETT